MIDYLKPICLKLFSSILAVCFIAMPVAMASDSERHQQINGMDVYLGVIPSQLAASDHLDMHGINVSDRHVYHVLVALFDGKTGKRITDATVQATVTDHALTTVEKVLGAMHTDDAVSYGNYFPMSVSGQYRIKVEIQRPDIGSTAAANFVYQRPQN